MHGPALVALVCAAALLTISLGLRQSFGIFLAPMAEDLEIGRQVFGLAIALQNLIWGLIQPFIGALADRHGAGKVLVGGGLLYALGLLFSAQASSVLGLQISLGGMVGIAMAGTTYAITLGVVGRLVRPEKRTLAFGICTAGGSFGMFAVVPGAQAMIEGMGWQGAFLGLAALALVMVPLGIAIGKAAQAAAPPRMSGPSLMESLRVAARHRGYWLLNAGFFVCGFHIAFIATHLPAYCADNSLSPGVTSWALASIGLFNIAGSLVFGALGGRYREKHVLSGIYFARAVVISLFLAAPISGPATIIFGAVMGFLWLGTVPLTTGMVARVFGARSLSMLYGIVFLSHQVGAFMGAWGGGLAYDVMGSYDVMWWVSVGLGIMAGLLHLPITDRPVIVEEPAPA